MTDRDTLSDYLDALASKSATPGGGAAAALCGAQACALIAMVCRLTRRHEDRVQDILARAESARARLGTLAEEDVRRFEAVMSAYRLPAERRDAALQPALVAAAQVPLEVIDEAVAMTGCIEELARIGNPNLVTDTGIASLFIEATVRASRLNVLVNLNAIDDAAFVTASMARLDEALRRVRDLAAANAAIDVALAANKESPPSSNND